MKPINKLAVISVALVLFAVVLVVGCKRRNAQALQPAATRSDAPVTTKTFDGPSDALKYTQIVPTLDTPIKQGQNAIWCASLLSAWKTLERDLAREPIAMDGAQGIVDSLNKARDPRSEIPAQALYVAAGWTQNGIVERIKSDLKRQFPSKEPPSSLNLVNGLVAYSYLEANAKFTIPYFQSREPLEFTDSQGRNTKISSFGIRQEDEYGYHKLRAQPRVLFEIGSAIVAVLPAGEVRPPEPEWQFAVDLCADSSPSQIVVARINREATLAAAVKLIERESKKSGGADTGIGINDLLLVPDLFWKITHHYSELQGKAFKNSRLKGQTLGDVQQDILFRLDRNGAELTSEAIIPVSPGPKYFILDRPFLIYMKKRDAKTPYFVMWVDNAELLSRWKAGEK